MPSNTNNEFEFQKGEVLLMDKPKHWTSFDVTKKLRGQICRKLNVKRFKIGHAGTLDPLATGLIILCTGKATKQIADYQAQEKEYIAKITLGATTPSYDLETEIDQEFPYKHITEADFREAAQSFIGVIQQIPPAFSAKKINGERAYKKARKGLKVDFKPSTVEVMEIEILNFNLPEVEVRIACGKGTYIRSLAYDIGKKLNSGAHLSYLRRTRIGNFSVNDAFSIEEFGEILFPTQ